VWYERSPRSSPIYLQTCAVAHDTAESELAEARQHEQELEQKAKEAKATLQQRKGDRKDIAAKNRQARCADSGIPS
jgi:hypothetical protein